MQRERQKLQDEKDKYLKILRQVGEDREPIEELALDHVLGVEERRDPEVLLRHGEGQLVVAEHVLGVEAVEVDEVGAVVVDDGAEAEAAPPAGRHVVDADAGVVGRHPAAPRLQRLGPVQRHPGGLRRRRDQLNILLKHQDRLVKEVQGNIHYTDVYRASGQSCRIPEVLLE